MFLNQVFRDFEENPSEETDYYKIIGCDPSATTEQILAEYRNRALQCHPDKCNTNETERCQNEKKFCRLSQAKNVLLDPVKRRDYDRWRESGLMIPYARWQTLGAGGAQGHTSVHWTNTRRNQPKAIIAGKEESEFESASGRFERDSKPDPILQMFRNYQI